jgi:hypothetical protein
MPNLTSPTAANRSVACFFVQNIFHGQEQKRRIRKIRGLPLKNKTMPVAKRPKEAGKMKAQVQSEESRCSGRWKSGAEDVRREFMRTLND